MLDPWIIEEILKREEEHRREQERGRVELPLNTPIYQEKEPSQPARQDDDGNRGVVIIDI